MTRLEQLKARVEALPGKREKQNLVDLLRKFGEDLSGAKVNLATAATQVEHARRVFAEIPRQDVDDAVKKAALSARRLRSTLEKNLGDILTPGVEKRVVALKDSAKDAASRVRDSWKTMLDRQVDALRPVVSIARSAKLQGGEELAHRLDRLEAFRAPATSEEAAALKSQLESLREAVVALGLKGKAGEFLMSAAQGRARAKDLEHPEVRDVLERFQLWDRLSIRLG
ncbi:hypothetical protein [Archangium lansingense]|uniref:Uncharacterized protein n=1 Tax=Archangium lansingense TaxID=2995310 RepID=A0ABT4ABV9_9BACT|nr:hypothetical protein [Archangium lansinium]MCY1079130.1 hypothetical protein [Archangium lansinium]